MNRSTSRRCCAWCSGSDDGERSESLSTGTGHGVRRRAGLRGEPRSPGCGDPRGARGEPKRLSSTFVGGCAFPLASAIQAHAECPPPARSVRLRAVVIHRCRQQRSAASLPRHGRMARRFSGLEPTCSKGPVRGLRCRLIAPAHPRGSGRTSRGHRGADALATSSGDTIRGSWRSGCQITRVATRISSNSRDDRRTPADSTLGGLAALADGVPRVVDEPTRDGVHLRVAA